MLRLFSVRGIPVAAHWSLLLAVGIFGWRAGSLTVGLVVAFLLFSSVLLHELGHALVATRLGLPISGIDLNIYGGTAKMSEAPRSPREEVVVAIAGPLVSLALAVVGFVGLQVVPGAAPVLGFVAYANLGLFLFNLLPALPMDGGRVLRALLASRFGFIDGTRKAVSVGVALAVLLGIYGLWQDTWLVVIAFVIWNLGRSELLQVRRSQMLDQMGLSSDDPWARYRKNAHDDTVAGDAAAGRPRAPDAIVMPDGTRVILR